MPSPLLRGGTVYLSSALALLLLAAPSVRAAYIISIQQVGSNVVANGSGSIDVTDLTFQFLGSDRARVSGVDGAAILGPTTTANLNIYSGATGPATLGSKAYEYATTGSGPLVGVSGLVTNIVVPQGYASGSTLATSTDTWTNQTFATLGITPGTYKYTWGTGPDADSLTVQIGPAAPEPASLALLALPALALRRRRRQ